jgi:hypothetical protein
MTALETRQMAPEQVDLAKPIWDQIRGQLEAEKARIYGEIGSYPTPIAGCDQQFNYLLEEQRRILRELARLEEAVKESLTAGDPLALIDEFIRGSSYSITLHDLRRV